MENLTQSADTLSEHQKLLLSMLKDFDAVCRKHNIQYMLFAGTALGAVRHRGFIPWDDDADVIMLRSEYERFFECAAKDFDTGKYFVQREFSPHWPMQFSKLRLNNTACIEKYHPKYYLHGHVHMSYGKYHKRYDKYMDTHVLNAFDRCVFEFEAEDPGKFFTSSR